VSPLNTSLLSTLLSALSPKKILSNASTLKKRILTASLLIPLFIGIILYSSLQVFSIISALIIGMAAWEWTHLAGFKSLRGRSLALLAMPSIILVCFAILQSLSSFSYNEFSYFEKIRMVISWGVLAFWVLASIAVTIYPRGKKLYQNKNVNLLIGIVVLLPAWTCAIALQAVSPHWLIYPLVLIYVADTAAYFLGKKWGKYHFSPQLSPGKTMEGVAGAVVAGLVVAGIGFFVLNVQVSFLSWFLLNLLTILFSIVGDLFESLFKRQQNLKDSGSLLPGHGGVLDRLDSVTAALPVFTIGLMI